MNKLFVKKLNKNKIHRLKAFIFRNLILFICKKSRDAQENNDNNESIMMNMTQRHKLD
uniref:Uncharacterized protein n=1 Tax=Tetranychus urticae TaxID=32264 RepID=T1JZ11_TETUR